MPPNLEIHNMRPFRRTLNCIKHFGRHIRYDLSEVDYYPTLNKRQGTSLIVRMKDLAMSVFNQFLAVPSSIR
jgi:hypothetical protein